MHSAGDISVAANCLREKSAHVLAMLSDINIAVHSPHDVNVECTLIGVGLCASAFDTATELYSIEPIQL